MKQYTVQEAAMALGVDVQTLNTWLSRNGNQAHIDLHDPQQIVFNQEQVEQLAREHNLPLVVTQTYPNGVTHAVMPASVSQVENNQVPHINVHVATIVPQGNRSNGSGDVSTAVPHPISNPIVPANVPDLEPIPLEAPIITIGRVSNNTLVLNHPQVSNYHARLECVGSSGVGKTTLLNALSGLRPAQKGEVLYNGQDYYDNLAVYNTQLGYVPPSMM